jgi:hypothetical protein
MAMIAASKIGAETTKVLFALCASQHAIPGWMRTMHGTQSEPENNRADS